MANSCSLDVYIRNKNNEVVESELWKNIKKHSKSRETAKRNYAIASNPQYVEKLQEEGVDVKFDKNGEMTFGTFRKLPLSGLTDKSLLESLNKEIKADRSYTYEEAVAKIQEFNRNEDYKEDFLATFKRNSDGKYSIAVVKNNSKHRYALHKQIKQRSLRDQILYQLQKMGVSVEFLEKDEHFNGRYSTENAQMAANGMYALITIADGKHVDQVLAEEAGHFAVGSLGDSPLVQRLLKALTPEVQQQILGEEYDEKSLGPNPAREVAGKLVGRSLIKQGSNTVWGRLADRIANLAKTIFATITNNSVLKAEAEAERIADKIAYGFMSEEQEGSVQNALSVEETLYSSKYSDTKVYTKMVKNLESLVKDLEVLIKQQSNYLVTEDKLTDRIQELLTLALNGKYEKQTDESLTQEERDAYALQGIAIITKELLRVLGGEEGANAMSLLNSVTFDAPGLASTGMLIAKGGNTLRQVQTLQENVDIVCTLLSQALKGYTQKLSSKEVTVTDTNGEAVVENLEELYKKLSEAGDALKEQLYAKERAFFLYVLRNTLGTDYVTRAAQIVWKKHSKRSIDTVEGGRSAIGRGWIGRNVLKGGMYRKGDTYLKYKECKDIIYKLQNNQDLKKREIKRLQSLGLLDLYEDQEDNTDQIITQLQVEVQTIEEETGKLTASGIYYKLTRQKEEKISIEDALDELEWDQGWLGTFFRSMSNSPDLVSVIVDKFTKEAKYQSTKEVNHIWDRLKVLQKQFSALKGVSEKDLYEQWEDGKLTGNFLTQYHYGKYDKAKKEYIDSLKKEFRVTFAKELQNMSPRQQEEALGEYINCYLEEWHAENSVMEDDYWVPNDSYRNPKYDALMQNQDFRKFYNEFMAIKRKCDRLCDYHMPYYRAPQIKGTFINRITNAPGMYTTNAGRVILNKIGAAFCEDAEDRDFGSDFTTSDRNDTEREKELDRIKSVPLFAINPLSHPEDMSTNPFHSMLAFAAMASNYSKLTTVADALSIGAEVLQNREVQGRRDRGISNTYKRYLKYLDRQVLGRSSDKHILSILSRKAIGEKILTTLTSMGSTLFLMGNWVGGVVNTGTGTLEDIKEAVVGEYFDLKDLAYAHALYWKSIPYNIIQTGKKSKNDKVSLFIKTFDILHTNQQHYREWHKAGLSNFSDAVWDEIAWAPYSRGDHYMQTVIYIALAKHMKLYDKDNNETTLWDILEVSDNVNNDYDNITKIIEKLRQDPTANLSPDEQKYIMQIAHMDVQTVTIGDALKRYRQDIIINRLASLQRYYSSQEEFDPEHPDPTYTAIQNLINKFKSEPNEAILTNQELYLLKRARVPAQANKSFEELLRDNSKQLTAKEIIKRLKNIRKYCHNGKTLKLKEGLYSFMPNADKQAKYLVDCYNAVKQGLSLDPGVIEVLKSLEIDVENLTKNQILYALEERVRDMYVSDRSLVEFKMRAQEIALRCHGIYNSEDYSYMQSTLCGKALSALKGYAYGMIEKRWGANHYSEALGGYVEGFHNTAFKVAAGLIWGEKTPDSLGVWQTITAFVLPFFMQKRMMKAGYSQHQWRNMIRNWINGVFIIGLHQLVKLLGPDDDDKEKLSELIQRRAALKRKKKLNIYEKAKLEVLDSEITKHRTDKRYLLYYYAQRLLWEQSAFSTAYAMYTNKNNLLDLTPVALSFLGEVFTISKQVLGQAAIEGYYGQSYAELKENEKLLKEFNKKMEKKYGKKYPDGDYPYNLMEQTELNVLVPQVSDAWIYDVLHVQNWFDESDIFYQQGQEGRYEKYEPKWKNRVKRYTPIIRNEFIFADPITAFDNYMYGQTVKAR